VDANSKTSEVWSEPPKSKDIKLALAHPDPKQATEEMKRNMSFLLTVVFPAIDAKTSKREFRGVGVMAQLQNALPQEMAMAWVLLDHFSDLDQIKFNLGLTTEDGTEKETAEKPQRKKRRKTMTTEVVKAVERQLLKHIRHCEKMVQETTFQHRMKEWDKLFSDYSDDSNNTPPRNHVPLNFQHMDDNQPGEFDGSFLTVLDMRQPGDMQMFSRLEQAGWNNSGPSNAITAAAANEMADNSNLTPV